MTLAAVLAATELVMPAIEIIDARIEQFDRDTKAPRKVFDTIAELRRQRRHRHRRPAGAAARRRSALGGRELYKKRRHRGDRPGPRRCSPPRQRRSLAGQQIAPYDEQLNAGDVVLCVVSPGRRPRTGRRLPCDYGPLGAIAFRFA